MCPTCLIRASRAAVLVLAAAFSVGCSQVDPGERGVKVSLGEMDDRILDPGFYFLNPFTTSIWTINTQQQTGEIVADAVSSNKQQLKVTVSVLYRIPAESTITIQRDYQGDPFDSLVVPRVLEAVKEATATRTADEVLEQREQIKAIALEASRRKIGGIMLVEDLVIQDIGLSAELTEAIEQKMIAEQAAEKAVFTKQQAQTDAETAIIKARGEAEAIRITGEALQSNPKLVDLRIAEKWNGVAPLYVGGGANILLPTPQR